jgi:hypothetical protein
MDLVTLIAACALSVEPKAMHALIWEQSGGEPWSFSVPDESLPRVLPTIQDAIREARATRPNGGRIRVGLTGLSADPRSVTAALFARCPNITLAARQITRLAERCKTTTRSTARSRLIVARGIGPTPGSRVPSAPPSRRATRRTSTCGRTRISTQATSRPRHRPDPHAALTAPPPTPDDRARGWASGLFPAMPAKPDSTSSEVQNGDRATDERRLPSPAAAVPAASKAPVDSLFVPRSSERKP